MDFKSIFIFAFFIVTRLVTSLDIPPGMYLCGRKTPDLDGCVSKSITSMVPYFRKGVLELGVASMDPMFIEEVSMANIPNFRALARNADLLGLSNFTFTSVKFDAENQTIIGEVTYKRIVFNADLNVWAKIIVPINETGRLKSESAEVIAKFGLTYKKYEKLGVTRLFFPRGFLKLDIRNYRASFTSFNNSPLTEAINAVINDSSKEITESMTPHLEREITKRLLKMCNNFSKHYTFDQLSPNRE